MFSSAMLHFLTKDSITDHVEYMNTIKSKYSIIEKSYPILAGKNINEIMSTRIPYDIRQEAKHLMLLYLSHRTYFESFAENDKPCPEAKKYYSSENAFCYETLELAKRSGEGFIYFFKTKNRAPLVVFSAECDYAYARMTPILALDTCEHAYFADYGFNRDAYLRAAVSRLDIAKLFK